MRIGHINNFLKTVYILPRPPVRFKVDLVKPDFTLALSDETQGIPVGVKLYQGIGKVIFLIEPVALTVDNFRFTITGIMQPHFYLSVLVADPGHILSVRA